ncbi:MAG: hypothetical protein U0694_19360 [Anaerolineae bacterium]
MDKQAINQMLLVKSRYENELLKKPHVVGVGVGVRNQNRLSAGEPCIVVMVDKLIPSAQLAPEDRIPTQLDGVCVDIHEVGTFLAHSTSAH